MTLTKLRILFVLLIVFGALPAEMNLQLYLFAQQEQVLFRIERSRDADEIWYTTNMNSLGKLETDIPIKAFWVRKTGDSEREALTRVQQKFGYGIKMLKPLVPNEWRFRIAAYKDELFILKKAKNNSYKVFTNLRKREIEVSLLYVEFSGGSYLAPKIAYVKLLGNDSETGSKVINIIKNR